MEHQNDLTHRLTRFEGRILTQKNLLRLFVILSVILALAAGLGWERYSELNKNYAILQAKHDRLNRIYIKEHQ